MSTPVFDHPPSVELLQWLARESLRQKDVLSMAVRLWVILRSLYGAEHDAVKLDLEQQFTYIEWRQKFFADSNTHPGGDEIPGIHDDRCYCAKTISQWLFAPDTGISESEWRQSFSQHYSLSNAEIDRLLDPVKWVFAPDTGIAESEWRQSFYKRYSLPQDEIDRLLRFVKHSSRERHKDRPFAFSRKTLQKDLKTLVKLGWLHGENEQYHKVQPWPSVGTSNQKIETETFDFLPPDLTTTTDNFSQPINSVQRFYLHVDYVVSKVALDKIRELQEQLKQIWEKTPVPPIKITYDSASLWREGQRIVYPVCIYYIQRALYLYAFGQTPKDRNQIAWYDYRLDRIQDLTELTWADEAVPQRLRQQCQNSKPPSLDEIQEKMAEAWGPNFYRQSQTMLLRFDRDFHDRYIQDTSRHDTFRLIDIRAAAKLIEKYTQTSDRQQLLNILQNRDNDAYYQAIYRIDDNNTVMRLRAWGPKVEVLLPGELRDRMAIDAQNTWELYK